jgi:hypothetical protein
MCIAPAADGKQCGRLIAAKNTISLSNHLKFNHTSAHKAVVDVESARKLPSEGTKKRRVQYSQQQFATTVNVQLPS